MRQSDRPSTSEGLLLRCHTAVPVTLQHERGRSRLHYNSEENYVCISESKRAGCFSAWPLQSPARAYQLLPGQPAKPANPSGPAADPLGRDTPSGTLYGFLQAAQSGNYSTAAQYLQMSAARRQTQGEDVATKLKVVIDRVFQRRLAANQQSAGGTPQEGMPLDKQRVGSLIAGDVDADLTPGPRLRCR